MRFFLLLLGLSVLLVGCAGSGTKVETLEERLDAALAITDVNLRGRTLSRVAADATEAGNVDVVKKAVADLPELNLKGSVASACATKLAAKGQHEAATDIARLIPDPQLRNSVLSRLSAKR
jgi:hypothetical protein